MHSTKFPNCGHETATPDCPDCDHAAVNGAAKPSRFKPPPPAELAGRVFEPVPPEVAEEFRRTFNEAEFLAEMDEALKTGGVRFEAIMAEIERKVHGRN